MTMSEGRRTERSELAIIREGTVYWVEAPAGIKIYHGDRSLGIDFDQISLGDGELYLPRHILELARRGEKGFRVVGEEPLRDVSWDDFRGRTFVKDLA
jgi:hypothetical protein